jgi:AmiR/NasT family two-component response regulator
MDIAIVHRVTTYITVHVCLLDKQVSGFVNFASKFGSMMYVLNGLTTANLCAMVALVVSSYTTYV